MLGVSDVHNKWSLLCLVVSKVIKVWSIVTCSFFFCFVWLVAPLQRFEHSNRLHKKISSFIAFPEYLDMTPFMSHRRNINNNLSPSQCDKAARRLTSTENMQVPVSYSNNS